MFLVFAGASASQFHSYLFEQRGFAGYQVGFLISAGYAAGLISPLIQVKAIRLFGGAKATLLAFLAGTVVTLACIPLLRGFWPLLSLFFLFSFFSAAIFPLNTACTLDAVRSRGHGLFFGIRGLGTVGFLAGCLVSSLFDELSALTWLYLGFAGAYLLSAAVIARDYPGAAEGGSAPRSLGLRGAASKLLQGRTGKLLLVMGVMNFANALSICLQGNYLTHRWEGGQVLISRAWVMSTACEVPLFLLCAWMLRRFGLRWVLAIGLFGTLVKLIGVALATEYWHYLLALSMHGFFYSGAVTGFNVYLDRNYSREDLPSLQALSVVFFQGLPNALAGLSAGLIWHLSSLRAVYVLAAGIAIAISLYGFRLLAKPVPGRETTP